MAVKDTGTKVGIHHGAIVPQNSVRITISILSIKDVTDVGDQPLLIVDKHHYHPCLHLSLQDILNTSFT
ncbi:hypothetical protein MAR_003671 [Mya arenaria]|uniref:Uncharacterized protein n=1 Tax=Mya arenaria TaxID=6604 RepID=A0ABY7G6T6_MYAAR|nr:hypothetical protein MAR_003671 [Mya arenaria]